MSEPPERARRPLQAETPPTLADALGVPLAVARKIVASVHRGEPLGAPIPTVSKDIIRKLHTGWSLPALEVVASQGSALDPFEKLLLRGLRADTFETVRIPLERAGRFSVCVSSQIGCALGCAFCATGRMGLVRNLEAWEIVEQVRLVRAGLPPGGRVHGVVFQGMGEPLANLGRVLAAIRVMTEPSALAIDARNVTVCTSGLPSGILQLATEAPRVRLGLSIFSARPTVRRSLMPITEAHPLAEVLAAAAEHAKQTGLAPMWAVTPIRGKNHAEDDARALGEALRAFVEASGVRPRVTLVPYNAEGPRDPFERLTQAEESAFFEALRRHGVFAHRRYSGGSDIGAACGQLRTNATPRRNQAAADDASARRPAEPHG